MRITIKAFPPTATRLAAVFDASGKLPEARNGAVAESARDALRDAVRHIDKLRTAAGRSDPDAALQNWEAPVRGRWSIVDKFDTDGRRFVIAVRNDVLKGTIVPNLADAENAVLALLLAGSSNEDIARRRVVSVRTVANQVQSIFAKLGARSRGELITRLAASHLATSVGN